MVRLCLLHLLCSHLQLCVSRLQCTINPYSGSASQWMEQLTRTLEHDLHLDVTVVGQAHSCINS